MSDIYLIEPSIAQWRTALIDHDEVPVEVHFYSDALYDPDNMVATARVTKVDKTLDMAFVTLPGPLNGMLNYRHAKPIAQTKNNSGKLGPNATISDCVHEGELIKVQATGQPSSLENKSIKVNGKIKIVGRYVVVESGNGRLNLSKDLPPHVIGDFKKALEPLAQNHAIIVRSRAEGVPTSAVIAETLWIIEALEQTHSEPSLLFAPSPLEQALMHTPESTGTIIIEGGENFARAKEICHKRWPDLLDLLKPYKNKEPLFEFYGVEEAIEEALSDKITLPCGGWIAVYETPALTAIDVNMGSALKGQSAAEAKRIVNLEAALAIAFHMRFQNMGGLIVADFIDNAAKGAMAEMTHYLEDALAQDPVPVQKSGMSSFGLMQFNRRRRGLSLRQRAMQTPPVQDTLEYQAFQIIRKAEKSGMTATAGPLVLCGSSSLIAWLKEHKDIVDKIAIKTSRTVEFAQSHTSDAFIKPFS